MQIIDDFILPHYQNKIEAILTSTQFPYFYSDDTINTLKTDTYFTDSNTINEPQFSHVFVNDGNINSPFFTEVQRITIKLEEMLNIPVDILRCKANLNLKSNIQNSNKYNFPHIDNTLDKSITAIYYVNDSDGDTYFFDKKNGNIIKQITPKKGRLIFWNGLKFHAKGFPIITNKRIVININLFPRE